MGGDEAFYGCLMEKTQRKETASFETASFAYLVEELLVDGRRRKLSLSRFNLGVDLSDGDFAVDRFEGNDIVPLIVDSIHPLFRILPGVLFNAHLFFFQQDEFLDAIHREVALKLIRFVR